MSKEQCIEKYPEFSLGKDMTLTADFCQAVYPYDPPTRAECKGRFPLDHDMALLTKDHENLRADYIACNRGMRVFIKQTFACGDELMESRRKVANLRKQLRDNGLVPVI